MNDLLDAILLGLIEGLTEFLPISSTGHLLIAEHWLGLRSDLFNITIQAGAILAVTLVYRQRLWAFARGMGDAETRDYVLKLAASFLITGVLGLAVKKLGVELPETVGPVAVALVLGGVVIIGIERYVRRLPASTRVSWSVAIAVGLAQVLAGVFPGTSRSAAAIFAAMLLGLTDRPRAAEFAFLVGIPTMFAAAAYELLALSGDPQAFAQENWTQLGAAFAMSAVTGFVSVVWLIRYITTHDFVPFAWYRIVLGLGLLALV
ncbi:MAG: undecaprenyl-diphosphate phosphatase [Panacagrimonas sp.]